MASNRLRCTLFSLAALALGVACGNGDDNGGGGGSGADGGIVSDELPPLGSGVSTLSGSSEGGAVDGPRGTARFNNPVNVAVGPNGNVYVADFDNSMIRAVAADGEVWTVPIDDERFWRPFGIAFSPDGTLWVQTDGDSQREKNGALWRVDVDGGATLAQDEVGRMRGLAVLPDGRIAMTDFMANVVSLYDPNSGAQTVIAGTPDAVGYNDGVGASARFSRPYGLVVLPDGDLLVTDYYNHRLRRVTVDGIVTTYAGTGTAGGADGSLSAAEFNNPIDVAIDASGTIYVSDAGGYRLRRVQDGQVTTIAGTGEAGWEDAEDPMAASFYGMEGIATDGDYLYVADGNRGRGSPYHYIRRVDL